MFQTKLEEILANYLHDYDEALPSCEEEGSEKVLPFLRDGVPPIVIEKYEDYANCSLSAKGRKSIKEATREWLRKKGKLS